MSGQVFHDPSGKRRGIVGRVVATIFFLGLVLFIAFGATIFIIPSLAGSRAQFGSFHGIALPTVARAQRAHELDKIRSQLGPTHQLISRPATTTVALGFLAPWEPTAIDSLRAAAPHLTHVAPVWLRLTPSGEGLDTRDFVLRSNPNNGEILTVAHKYGTKIIPVITNSKEGQEDGTFDPIRVDHLLTSPKSRAKLITEIVFFLTKNHFQGINLDFEDLDQTGEKNLPIFLRELGAALHQNKFELSVDVQTAADQLDLASCAASCDFLVLMAYDYASEDGKAGPIAPLDWSVKQVEQFLKRVPANKVVLLKCDHFFEQLEAFLFLKGVCSRRHLEKLNAELVDGVKISPPNVLNLVPREANQFSENIVAHIPCFKLAQKDREGLIPVKVWRGSRG